MQGELALLLLPGGAGLRAPPATIVDVDAEAYSGSIIFKQLSLCPDHTKVVTLTWQ
jgi:hypothetical protein